MSRWEQSRPWLTVLLRLVVGVVLLVAGATKLADPGASVRAVRAYELLPESIVPVVAVVLPIGEVVLGALLIVGLFVRWAALGGGLLMAAFVAGIASAWARGLNIDCGCFGGGGEVAAGDTRYVQEILRDLGLLASAAVLARWPASRLSVDSWLRGSGRSGTTEAVAAAEAEAAALESAVLESEKRRADDPAGAEPAAADTGPQPRPGPAEAAGPQPVRAERGVHRVPS